MTYNCKVYDTYESASTGPYGHSVLSIWGQETNRELNDTMFGAFGELQSVLGSLKHNFPVEMAAFNLSGILTLVDPASYFRYSGSLTTPPCTENAIWTVFTRIVPVSNETVS